MKSKKCTWHLDLASVVAHWGLEARWPDTVSKAQDTTQKPFVGAGPSPPAHTLSHEYQEELTLLLERSLMTMGRSRPLQILTKTVQARLQRSAPPIKPHMGHFQLRLAPGQVPTHECLWEPHVRMAGKCCSMTPAFFFFSFFKWKAYFLSTPNRMQALSRQIYKNRQIKIKQ